MTLDLNAELTRGYDALKRGALDDAAAVAEVVVAGAPDHADAWRLLARVQLMRGDRSAARATLQDAIGRSRDPLFLHADLAELALKDQDSTTALAAALAARGLGGDHVRWVLLTGKARWAAGDRTGALVDFKLAAANAPDIAKVQIALARALFGSDLVDEGIAVLERSIARHGGGLAAALLALATLDSVAPARSLPAVDAALALTPAEPTLNLLKAMLLTIGGDADAAPDFGAATEDSVVLRARWEMFEHLHAADCERFVGRPQQVLEHARAVCTLEGIEIAFGPSTELSDLPAGPIRLLRIDRRDHDATAALLATLADRVHAGTVVAFDAYLGYPGARGADFAAWQAFVTSHGLRCRYLAGCLMGSEVALRIEAIAPVAAR